MIHLQTPDRRNVRSSWKVQVELFSPFSLNPHRRKMQYPNLAKGSQPNANAYDQFAKPSTNFMQAALAAMGWAALCPSSTLTFFKQRKTLWEPDTGFQDTGTGNTEDDTWLIRLIQSRKATALPESSVTEVGPSAAGEEVAVTTRKGETRKHRDTIHKLWLPTKEPRMARMRNRVM